MNIEIRSTKENRRCSAALPKVCLNCKVFSKSCEEQLQNTQQNTQSDIKRQQENIRTIHYLIILEEQTSICFSPKVGRLVDSCFTCGNGLEVVGQIVLPHSSTCGERKYTHSINYCTKVAHLFEPRNTHHLNILRQQPTAEKKILDCSF
jgi:hypothetical protein